MARFLVSNGYKQQSIVPFGTYRFKMRDPALKCWATLVASLWDKSPTSILSATSSLYPRRYVNLQKPKGRLAAVHVCVNMLTSRVLRVVAVWGLFCLTPNHAMLAKEERGTFDPKPLDIHVQANGFGRVVRLISLFICFTSNEPLLAECSSLSSLAELRLLAQRLC
jgi:hypothetical protein